MPEESLVGDVKVFPCWPSEIVDFAMKWPNDVSKKLSSS